MHRPLSPHKTRNDILLIAILAAVAVLSICLLRSRPANTRAARVLVDGTAVLTIPLTQAKEYPLDTPYGHVTIAVQDAQIRFRTSDCPDQLCVRQGPLKPGAPPLCCLPNHVLIEYASPADATPYDILIGGLP